ncbi:MAG: hypothetical protein M3Q69_00180 [Acidobacteriota bacterium]|nr:hypothetical protein [Acidobacteriota bacterium]
MRGRVKAVLVLSLLLSLSSQAFADCTWTPRQSYPFRTTALDVSVDANFVWMATGYGVQLIEGTRVASSLPIPGSTRVVQADGRGYAYVGSGSRLYVVRRDNAKLTRVTSLAASGTINDIVLAGAYLFVATTNGIDHFDVNNAANPVKTSAAMHTSSPNVTSLSTSRNNLYAADGDTSLEVFSIVVPSLPQHTTTIETTLRATAVHATADSYLYVSDFFGQSTDIISGTSRIATLPYGLNAIAAGSQAQFAAGPDRTLRGLDLSSPTRPIELFEEQLAGTEGTDNVIHDLERSGDMLYVAAGDIGLVVLDVASIAKPFPLASYTSGATTGVRALANKAWFSDVAGNVTEQKTDANGIALSVERSWNAGEAAVVRDLRDNGLLTTSGPKATIWALVANPPVAASTFTFADTIVNAVSGPQSVIALLPNGSLYVAFATQPTPKKINVPPTSLLARSGSAIAAAEIRESGDTVLHYWANGDVTAEPRHFNVSGAATGNIALDATRAALFTFNGINVIDLATGAVRVIAGSTNFVPRQLAFAGNDLLALDSRRLAVYADARTLLREQPLPADASALDVSGTIALLATNEGVAASRYAAKLPSALIPFANSYYTTVVAATERIGLFSRNALDVFALTPADGLRLTASIRAPGAIDVAATDQAFFTLSANGTVSAWSHEGVLLNERVLSEGSDAQPLSIHGVRNAVWLSLSTGCTTGGCIKKTLVLDPSSLATTATLSGAIRDLSVIGPRAFVLFDQPDEMRVYAIDNDLHPVQTAAAPRPPSATSISYASDRVYVLGDKLYSFAADTLAPAGDRLTAKTPDAAQRIRISETCAILTGRAEAPELYSTATWTAASSFEVPSNVRSIALDANGHVFLLTAHSLEIWSNVPAAGAPSRRRSVR